MFVKVHLNEPVYFSRLLHVNANFFECAYNNFTIYCELVKSAKVYLYGLFHVSQPGHGKCMKMHKQFHIKHNTGSLKGEHHGHKAVNQ